MPSLSIPLRFKPDSKSWTIRMGVLDLQVGRDDTIKFLHRNKLITGDHGALYRASRAWLAKEKDIPVGESRTLLIALTVEAKRRGLDKRFIVEGTLNERPLSKRDDIMSLSPHELLRLEGSTTQWATARYLAGDKRKVLNPSPKLLMTYEAVDHWENRRAKGLCWEPRLDVNITAQAEAYLKYLRTGKMEFEPKEAEDFCFARMFDLVSDDDGKRRWPSLAGHESNRLKSVSDARRRIVKDIGIDSKDHRVVQSAAMFAVGNGLSAKFSSPYCTDKSWPQFWDFIRAYPKGIYESGQLDLI